MIFPARCDDRLGYVFRTHLLHRPSQFGHQLEMIKQMALGRQIDAVGGLPWRLDVKGDKRRTVTRGNPVCFSDDAPGLLMQARIFSLLAEETAGNTSVSTFFSTRKATSFNASSRS